jgi:hypothetical protein
MIFCGAFALGNVSLLVGLASILDLGSRRGALEILVVGSRLFGGGGGGISSAESVSWSFDEAVFARGMPGREMGCCCCACTGALGAVAVAGCLRLDCDDTAVGVFVPIALAF